MIQNEENKHIFLSKRKINDKQIDKINKLEEYFHIIDKSNCLWTEIMSSPIKEKKKEKVKFDVKHNSPPQRKSTNYSIFSANPSEDINLSTYTDNKYSYSDKKELATSKIQWSEEDDKLLIFLRDHKKIATWVEISRYFNNKNPKQCSYRHKKLTSVYKTPWNEEEDLNLIKAIIKNGDNFEYLKHIFENRSLIELKKRYFSFLIKMKEMSSTEDSILMEIYNNKSINKEKFDMIKDIHYKIIYYRILYLLKFDFNSEERIKLLDLVRNIYLRNGVDDQSFADLSSTCSPLKKSSKRSMSISKSHNSKCYTETEKISKVKHSLNSDFNKMFMKMISINNDNNQYSNNCNEYKDQISEDLCNYKENFMKLEFKLFPLNNEEDNYINNNINITDTHDFDIENNDYDFYSKGLNINLNENISSHYEKSNKEKSSNSLLNSNLYNINENIFSNYNTKSAYDESLIIDNIDTNNQFLSYTDSYTQFNFDMLFKDISCMNSKKNSEIDEITNKNTNSNIQIMINLEKLLEKLKSSSANISNYIQLDNENREKFDSLNNKEKDLGIEFDKMKKCNINKNNDDLLVYIDLLIKLIIIHKDKLNLIDNKN